MDFCFPLFICLVIALIIVFLVVNYKSKENAKKLRVLKEAYDVSIRRLGESPSDPNLRKQAQEFGRYYLEFETEMLRKYGITIGSTLFDELALKKDIEAAGEVEGKEDAHSTIRDEIDCPFCAERILRKAIVCKHCGRDV